MEDSWGCPITPSLSSPHPNVSSSGLANNLAHLSLQHLQNIQALPQGPKTATPWTWVPVLGHRARAEFSLQSSWDSPTFEATYCKALSQLKRRQGSMRPPASGVL